MKHALAPAGRAQLAALAERRLLVGLDFDGTLAPLTPRRQAARMRATTRRLLVAVAQAYPCVIVSGRSYEDVSARVEGVSALVVGNHGAEWGKGASAGLRARVAGWTGTLGRLLRGVSGVELEDKTLSLSVHYRRAAQPAFARRMILQAAATLQGARLVPGTMLVNVVAARAPHKGHALERARRARRCDAMLFVGDEDTDEDAFAHDTRAPLLGVRVGRSLRSAAPLYLRDQREVDDLLAFLLRLRRGSRA